MHQKTPLLLTDLLVTPNRKIWLLFDILACFVFYTGAQFLNPYSQSFAFQEVANQIYVSAIIFSFCFGLLGVGLGIYDRSERFNLRSLAIKIPIIWILTLTVSVTIMYFIFYGKFGRLTFFLGSTGAALGISCLKVFFALAIKKNPYRFVILGHSPTATAIKKAYLKQNVNSKIYEIYETKEHAELTADILRSERIVDVVVSDKNLNDKGVIELCFSALQIGCRIIDEIDFYAQTFNRFPIEDIDKHWILREGFQNRRLMSDAVKRVFDIIFGCIALILTSPIFLLVYIAIWLGDFKNPILIQERQGRYCRSFSMLKFRTMSATKEAGDASFTEKNDPRITPIGKLIRPLHLDELPQLLNIIRGHMSIVGPRPEMLYFARKMSKSMDLYDLRYMFRPGLTGHAQLLTGYAMDSIEATRVKLSADLYYICKRTFLLDLGIIIRTVFKLTSGAR